MKTFTRITVDPYQMGGLPCIRSLRIPVATVIGLIGEGMAETEILRWSSTLRSRMLLGKTLRYAAGL